MKSLSKFLDGLMSPLFMVVMAILLAAFAVGRMYKTMGGF